MTDQVLERFWDKVKVDGETKCWNWTGAKSTSGYGRFKDEEGLRQSHRFAYEVNNGNIENGLDLDHLCRNKLCVNPEHLEAVTRKENLIRGLTGMITGLTHMRKTHCPKGHPYSGDNLYIRPDGQGRGCKKCIQLRSKGNREHGS